MRVDNRNSEKKIYLCIGNEGLGLFLSALLREWGFNVSNACPKNPNDLLLAEECCARCAEHRKRVDIISSAYLDNDQVNLPIVIEQLWRVLEKHYHLPPRNHLRLAIDFPTLMTIRGLDNPGRLRSLSPAGARLTLPRELATGEIFPMALTLGPQTLHLAAKVIYITTFPDSDNRYDAGVLFEKIAAEDKALLRDTIILTFLNNIRPHLPRWAFEVGINHFDLPPTVLKQL